MKMRFICMISVISLMSGCASIVSGGGSQTVTFNTTPSNATVLINGKDMGKTPLSVSIKRAKNTTVMLKKEGYKTRNETLAVGTNPWFFGNIIFGGLVGSSTDSSTGAINEYKPGSFMYDLTPEKS